MTKKELLKKEQTIFQDSFSEEIWANTYKNYSDETVDDTMYRVASAIAQAEETPELKEYWTEQFYDMLTNFKCTAGGRIYANAGTEFNGTTLINCYISPRKKYDIDSIDNIMLDLKNQALTLKSEGGWGQDFSYIRPRGAFIHGIGVESPGAIRFMELFDKSSEIVTAGSGKKSTNKKSKGKIRKGAMMATMSCLSGDTLISTLDGKIKIEDLVGKTPYLYCTDTKGGIFIRQATKVWKVGRKKTIKIIFDDDSNLICTPDHKILLSNGTYIEAQNLKFTDSVTVLHKRLYGKYRQIGITRSAKHIPEHYAVCEFKYGKYPTILNNGNVILPNSEEIHHIDNNSINNDPDNLVLLTREEHIKYHLDEWLSYASKGREKRLNLIKGKTYEEYYGIERANEIKNNISFHTFYDLKQYAINIINSEPISNHKVIGIEEHIEMDVYDISVPEFHNFVANNIFVHNCSHPDILEFITAKQSSGRLTKFNMSVNCTDKFMEKIIKISEIDKSFIGILKDYPYVIKEREELDKWNLIFPDTTHEKYKEEWDGNVDTWQEKGYPVVVYNTISAMGLWNNIMESTYNRAEPGIMFLDRANYFFPLNYHEKVVTSNPCVTGDTLILTENGYEKIEDLVDIKTNIWNGYEWSNVTPQITGTNQEILDIIFSDGSELSCTPYHKFILKNGMRKQAKDMTIEDKFIRCNFPIIRNYTDKHLSDAYTRGFYCGDGSNNKNEIFLYGIKKSLLQFLNYSSYSEHPDNNGDTRFCVNLNTRELNKNFVPNANDAIESRLNWLAGIIDSDGCEADGCAQISSVNKHFLVDIKLMLNTLGCSGVLARCKLAGTSLMPNGKGGKQEYPTQDLWRLNISANFVQDLIHLGLKTNRVEFIHLPNRISSRFITIKSVTKRDDIESKVYCFNEPKNHSGIFNGIITAQCSEQIMSSGDTCNLSSQNLTQMINEDYTDFDYEKIKKYAKIAVRFNDNVNDITKTPLSEYDYSIKNKRRIGIGILGWGSALYMLKTRISSPTANNMRDKVMQTLAKSVYEASIDLAIEKGKFSLCDPKKHAEGVFVNSIGLSDEYMQKLRTFGIRNSSLLSIQPTGNTAILANISSGGLEPVFMHEYVRTVIVNHLSPEMRPFTPKWFEGEFHETEVFKFAKEGDEEILKGVFEGTTYKIDKNRGLTKEVLCEDFGVRAMKKLNQWDSSAEWAATAVAMSAEDHLSDLAGFVRWVDSSASKTINLPNNYPFEDFKNIYLDAYKTGYIKGVTTYRAGTMGTVLSAAEEKNATDEDEEIILDHVNLPKTLPATMTSIKAEGRKWYITTTWNSEQTRPFALFVHTNSPEKGVTTNDAIECLSNLARRKGIPEEHIITNIEKMLPDNNSTKIARMISLNLRHGVLVKSIVLALDSVENVSVASFLFQIKKYLSSLIKDGEEVSGEKCTECGSKIIFQEGCRVCVNCGWSKCG